MTTRRPSVEAYEYRSPPASSGSSLLPAPDTHVIWSKEDTILPRKPPFSACIATIWVLALHVLLSVGLAIFVLVYVEGHYFNVMKRSPQVKIVEGTRATPFVPMQSDIVTLISAVIAILKYTLTTWAASLGWRIALFLMERRGLARRDLNILLQYGQLSPGAYKNGWSTLVIGALLLSSLAANLSSPLLTGSISWVPSSKLVDNLSLEPISFEGIESGALTALPDDYLNLDYVREGVSLRGAGMATIGWSRRIEKGVLKRVSSSIEALAVNSTVENVTMPYFQVHSLQWIKNADEIPRLRHQGPVAILEEYKPMAPVLVNTLPPGGVVIIPNGTITPWFSDPLNATVKRETVLVMMYHSNLARNMPPGVYTVDEDRGTFAFAWITYSAGVGQCKAYQCVVSSPSTIQNTTSIELEPHQLTYQSMLMVNVIALSLIAQNVSLPSPWNNLNDYIAAVFMRAYSGAWTVLNADVATGYRRSRYIPALPSLLAHVDRNRVFILLSTHWSVIRH
ncbi:unnamed protein product [Rhizoctonia solani]|uniref:Transmembrane protein n=1 Tax=Rhizoctonia solani TaxID=456999 RepID=A0A8H3E1D6_9AGAM|nr:unnamed protein product [Rhizoctonia solani]